MDRLIIRAVAAIDCTGAPPFGPADIVTEGDRIEAITFLGTPNVPIEEPGREMTIPGASPGSFVDRAVRARGVPRAEYVR